MFGNCEPLAVESVARRFVRALGTGDDELLDAVYDPDVILYTPLAWPIRGRDAVKDFVGQFHAANPGLRVTLHDEFASADGTRACFRFVIHFHNTGPFYGNPPTGEQGTMSETHAVRLRDVLFMTHAKPRSDEQAAMWKQLVDGTLPAPDTWEVALSSGADGYISKSVQGADLAKKLTDLYKRGRSASSPTSNPSNQAINK